MPDNLALKKVFQADFEVLQEMIATLAETLAIQGASLVALQALVEGDGDLCAENLVAANLRMENIFESLEQCSASLENYSNIAGSL